MGFVYKIVNLKNQKVYIGITKYKNPNTRFKKHIAEHNKGGNYSKRPLYEAMKKYGVKNFAFSVIEELPNSLLGKREKYWIKFYNSYIGFENSYGYNATLGGDGGHKTLSKKSKEEIINAYLSGYGMNYIVKNLHHSIETIQKCLKEYNVEIRHKQNRKVVQLEKNNNVIKIFNNIAEANEYFGKNRYASKINEVCNKKMKTAYGYNWKYL